VSNSYVSKRRSPVSCYAPPSWDSGGYNTLLERVGVIVDDIRRDAPDALIIMAGDFNARSPAWGDTRRNLKGQPLEDWMSGHGLSSLNVGRASTCVRPQGVSHRHYDGLPKCRTQS